MDARERHAQERKRIDQDMMVDSKFRKSSMTGEKFPSMPSMTHGDSTHLSISSLTRKLH